QSRQVSGFTHFDWNGVVDQVEKNLPIFLRHMGATPEGLKRPDFPTEFTPEAQDKYRKDVADYDQKVADFRKQHAAENGETAKKVLESLRLLGGGYEAVNVAKDGLEAVAVYRLDLSAVPEAAGEGDKASDTLRQLLEGLLDEAYTRTQKAR